MAMAFENTFTVPDARFQELTELSSVLADRLYNAACFLSEPKTVRHIEAAKEIYAVALESAINMDAAEKAKAAKIAAGESIESTKFKCLEPPPFEVMVIDHLHKRLERVEPAYLDAAKLAAMVGLSDLIVGRGAVVSPKLADAIATNHVRLRNAADYTKLAEDISASGQVPTRTLRDYAP